MDNADLESLIREQIEAPAARQIQSQLAAGLITSEDAELFRVSADRFKAAALAEYEGFDPTVRHQLVKAVLTSYQLEIGRLLTAINNRSVPPVNATKAVAEVSAQVAPAGTEAPKTTERSPFHRLVSSIVRFGRPR
jgi:cobalamin biosynthesis Mg chelatase CobN